ncbi:hypothetical protein S40288_09168 [Stachybotrys chartarum IBT 40288]|nr:hypothetical protein S40288_09168 [Stachybotrys chartarum IBT 40288]
MRVATPGLWSWMKSIGYANREHRTKDVIAYRRHMLDLSLTLRQLHYVLVLPYPHIITTRKASYKVIHLTAISVAQIPSPWRPAPPGHQPQPQPSQPPTMIPKLPKPQLPIPRRRRGSFTALLTSAVLGTMALFYLLLQLAPCIGRDHCYNGYQSSFSFDADAARHPSWMAELPDSVPLSSLSIPGTHDTMTYAVVSERLQCQNWNLSVQLDAGIRYLDIRARLRDDALWIYHADGWVGFGFEHVLLTVYDFLESHPTEAVVMRVKEEGKPIGRNNTMSFEDAFNYHRLNASTTAPGSAKHMYMYDPSTAAPLPLLGALRSRILLLQNFASAGGTPYGVSWNGAQMHLEDVWIIPDVYHLSDKWSAIRNSLERAATDPLDNRRLYLAHLSASVGVLPIEAAAGPMNRSIQGMNDMTGQWLRDFEDNDDATRTGIVIMDFPGERLIDAVLAWNAPLKKQ